MRQLEKQSVKSKEEVEKKIFNINMDVEMQKEVAKIGMVASLGVVTLTGFMMKNKVVKGLHLGSGFALIGFSYWHHKLYQQKK